MSFGKNNLIIGAFVLMAFIGVGVFGLFPLGHAAHGAEAPMSDCPYTENGSSLCENTLDHIAGWQQFSNIIIPALFIILALAAVFYLVGSSGLLDQKQNFYRWRHYLYQERSSSYEQAIIKWLSLFENSPSLSYVRHS
jgi:hypothetical protein